MYLPLLLLCALAHDSVAMRIISEPHSYINRTTTTPPPTTTTPAISPPKPSSCENCWKGTISAIAWEWPFISTSSLVVATKILKINRYTNTTSTQIVYNNVTAPTLVGSDYGPGVTIVDGTPIKTFTATVYTTPGEAITFTTDITFPTDYFNLGWLYWTAPGTATVNGTTICKEGNSTQFALTPTATPPGFTNAYEQPVNTALWEALLPASVTSCAQVAVAPAFALISVQALTDSSVIYDDTPPAAGGAAPAKEPSPPKKTGNSSPGQYVPGGGAAQPAKQPNPPTPAPTPKPQPPSQGATGNSPPPSNPQPGPPAGSPGQPNPQPGPPASSPGQPNPPQNIPNGASPMPEPVVTVGAQSFPVPINPVSPGAPIVIGSHTLVPGGPAITISGTPVSLAPSASAIVVGGSTVVIPPGAGATPLAPGASITVGGQIISAGPSGNYVVGGQTLVPGAPPITVSGTPISLGVQGTDVVVGTSTEGLGSVILNGLGGSATGTGAGSAFTGQTFEGAAVSRWSSGWERPMAFAMALCAAFFGL